LVVLESKVDAAALAVGETEAPEPEEEVEPAAGEPMLGLVAPPVTEAAGPGPATAEPVVLAAGRTAEESVMPADEAG
jgi:hypothetical protein